MSSINDSYDPTYVLLTAAKNEQRTVAITIESVLNQSTLPYLWIFVDDGSTDSTPEIVAKYSIQHPWIRLIKQKPSIHRDFANVVRAMCPEC